MRERSEQWEVGMNEWCEQARGGGSGSGGCGGDGDGGGGGGGGGGAAVAAAEKERENQCKCRRNATAEERVTEKLIVAKIFELEQVGSHQRVEETLIYLGV